VNTLGDEQNRVISPGDPNHSALFTRIENLGPNHMPPLATSVLNDTAIDLLSNWITNSLPIPAKDIALNLRANLNNGLFQLQFTRPANRAVEIQWSDYLSSRWQ